MKLFLGNEKTDGDSDCIYFNGDPTMLPYADKSIDFIHYSPVIDRFTDIIIKLLLVEWKRVLKDNGTLRLVVSDSSLVKKILDKTGFSNIQNINETTIEANNKPVKIIQTSPCGTASKLLANVVYGLISPNTAIDLGKGASDLTKDMVATHELELDVLLDQLSKKYKLYFIVSERRQHNKTIPAKYYDYDDIYVFQFEELNETPNNSVTNIVDTVYKKLIDKLPFTLNKKTAVERVNNMNALYERIKERPFAYYDKFYCIHGHHRGRNGMDYPCPAGGMVWPESCA